jgi:hypothetical protein
MSETLESRSCYLVSAAGVDTRALRKALQVLSVEPLSPAQTPPVGESSPRTLRENMRHVDFVVGLLEDHNSRENVLFELGVAVGLNKPLFLLVPPGTVTNFALLSHPHVKTQLDDADAIAFHLRQFLRNLRKRRQRLAKVSSHQVKIADLVPPWVDSLMSRVASLNESQLERQISEALSQAGFTTSIETTFEADERVYRPDIVAWFGAAPPSFGNPWIIEVKQSLDRQKSAAAIEQVKSYLRASNLRTAVVVAGSGAPDVAFESVENGYVFVISAERFLKELSQGSLFDTLVRRRNLATHSGGI